MQTPLPVRETHPAGDSLSPQDIDLLTVVLHEPGHILGYDHKDDGLMDDTLPPDTRRLPLENVDKAFAAFDESP
jgi:hypothetical protein